MRNNEKKPTRMKKKKKNTDENENAECVKLQWAWKWDVMMGNNAGEYVDIMDNPSYLEQCLTEKFVK